MTNQNDTKQCKCFWYQADKNTKQLYQCNKCGNHKMIWECPCFCHGKQPSLPRGSSCSHCTPPPATEGEEERKMPKKYELDLIFLINKLLDEYNKARISAPYKGKYPSPFEKAQNDISDLFTKTLQAQAEEIFKDLQENLNFDDFSNFFRLKEKHIAKK